MSERALLLHGALGVSNQTPLAALFGLGMHLSIADGPSEVHLPGIARMDLRNHDPADFERYYDVPVR